MSECRVLSHAPLICTDHVMSSYVVWAFCLQVEEALHLVEKRTGRVFGDDTNPLLLSVRSGARASMPGQKKHEHEETKLTECVPKSYVC